MKHNKWGEINPMEILVSVTVILIVGFIMFSFVRK